MNIQRPIFEHGHRPARFTAEAYVESRELINRLFEKTELLDGVIYEMAADGPRTTEWNTALSIWLVKSLPDAFHAVIDKTLRLAEYWAPTPDFHVIPADVPIADLKPSQIQLVIEVADTTLDYDLGEKAEAYAKHGIDEYWVIDPDAKCIHVHHRRADGTYDVPHLVAFADTTALKRIPELTLRLADLPRIS